MAKTIGKKLGKKLSDKHAQKFLDHVKQSGTEVLKTTPKEFLLYHNTTGCLLDCPHLKNIIS